MLPTLAEHHLSIEGKSESTQALMKSKRIKMGVKKG